MKLKVSKSTKKPKSFRDSVEKKAADENKVSRGKRVLKASSTPLKTVKRISKKEYHINKQKADEGAFLHKSRKATPSYFRNSFKELKNVTWPTRRVTFRLTIAVLVFSISFGLIVAIVDYGLDKLFKGVILK